MQMFNDEYDLTSDIPSELIVDLWSAMKGYISVKDRPFAAEHFISTLVDNGIEIEMHVEAISGACPILDKALSIHRAEEEDMDEDDYDDEMY